MYQKDFASTEVNIFINFNSKSKFMSEETLIHSDGFVDIFTKYLLLIKKRDIKLFRFLNSHCKGDNVSFLISLFALLLQNPREKVAADFEKYQSILEDSSVDKLLELLDGIYSFWRSYERYGIVSFPSIDNDDKVDEFLDDINNFNNLILRVNRKIKQNIVGHKQHVFHQLTAGVRSGIILNEAKWANIPITYMALREVPFINSVVLCPPMIVYPSQNKRSGVYNEVKSNPILDIDITARHWFCFPCWVGASLAFVYFNQDYMCHGVALANLFEMAKPEEYANAKPNLVYVFGAKGGDSKGCFYHDVVNDIYVGVANHIPEIDYFGYMKKLLLTLHNVRMIDEGNLPTHGSFVNIVMKSGAEANILIVGDSGVGKSESIEAFRVLSQDYLKEIKVIYDDMGTLIMKNGEVFGYGTETGAFIRLDDMEPGYAFQNIDKAIYMNPNKVNSRVLVPSSPYSTIMAGYKVDLILYADNFEVPNLGDEMLLFRRWQDAVSIFKHGQRKAKGTTTETGLVGTYFANPFGPMQRQEQTEVLLDEFFSKFQENNIPMGVIYTQLAVDNMAQEGPKRAAKTIFKWIEENKGV